MSGAYDAVVIGAGINGLVAAATLAKSKQRVLVVERRAVAGGIAAVEEIAPGCRVSPCQQAVGWLPRPIVDELQLAQHGLSWLDGEAADPPIAVARADGGWLMLSSDAARTAEALRAYSQADAAKWPDFTARLARLAGFFEHLYSSPPPLPKATSLADGLKLLQLGGRLRGMGRAAMMELLRTVPMPLADLLDDWFEDDALKGALAGRALLGVLQGPRSPGTAFLLVHRLVGAPAGAMLHHRRVRGGPGALVTALVRAAERFGVEIQRETDVASVSVKDGACTGVVLADGRTIEARAVLSSVDARRTLLQLAGAWQLDPELVHAVRNIRYRGVTGMVTLVVDSLPPLRGLEARGAVAGAGASVGTRGGSRPPGTVIVCPSLDHLERAYDAAKYGGISPHPYLEVTVPSLDDPSLCPPGQHLLSVTVQYVPYHLADGGWTDAAREQFGDGVVARLDDFWPGLSKAVVARHVLTPRDLETTYGLTEGSTSHGEMALDQFLFMRPVPGWAQYRTPLRHLYLCGAGTHPGGGIAGASGRLAAQAVLANRS